jgi:hypothetical protein
MVSDPTSRSLLLLLLPLVELMDNDDKPRRLDVGDLQDRGELFCR